MLDLENNVKFYHQNSSGSTSLLTLHLQVDVMSTQETEEVEEITADNCEGTRCIPQTPRQT